MQLVTKARAAQGAIIAASVGLATTAQAALPEGVTAAFTTVQTDAGSMIDAGWPVLVGITVGFVLMKLFKKVVSRAS